MAMRCPPDAVSECICQLPSGTASGWTVLRASVDLCLLCPGIGSGSGADDRARVPGDRLTERE
jgi:hypothetical protein